MIAERIERRPMQFLSTCNPQPVVEFLDRCAHRTKVCSDGCNPIGFLYPQLARIPDFDPIRCVRSNHRQYGDLIDQRSAVAASHSAASESSSLNLQCSHQFAMLLQ